MRRLLPVVLGLAVLTGCATPSAPVRAAPSPEQAPETLRVMTWNVLAREFDPPRWAPTIATERPDVVGLQEVCAADVVELAELLSAEHGLEYTAVPGPVVPTPEEDAQPINAALRRPCNDGADITFGLGVLTTLPVTSERTELFVPDNRDEQRGYQRLELGLPGGTTLTVHNTHVGIAGVQGDQLRAIAELAAAEPSPGLLLGDLNVAPDDARLDPLRASFAEVDPAGRLPTGGNDPDTPDAPALIKIDYVFQRGLDPAAPPRAPWVPSSDHRPLIADLAVP